MARPKKAAKVTWIGEDSLQKSSPDGGTVMEYEEGHGPSKNVWNGIEFRKGEAVEISDAYMIDKARANPFYSVEDAD